MLLAKTVVDMETRPRTSAAETTSLRPDKEATAPLVDGNSRRFLARRIVVVRNMMMSRLKLDDGWYGINNNANNNNGRGSFYEYYGTPSCC